MLSEDKKNFLMTSFPTPKSFCIPPNRLRAVIEAIGFEDPHNYVDTIRTALVGFYDESALLMIAEWLQEPGNKTIDQLIEQLAQSRFLSQKVATSNRSIQTPIPISPPMSPFDSFIDAKAADIKAKRLREWNSMAANQKQRFFTLADNDAIRHEYETNKRAGMDSIEMVRAKPIMPVAPRAPLPASILFTRDRLAQVRSADPTRNVVDMKNELQRVWRDMRENNPVKRKFCELANAEQIRYEEEREQYLEKKRIYDEYMRTRHIEEL